MVPVAAGETAAVGPLLDEVAFEAPTAGKPDVFVYELPLEDGTHTG
jgi:hypothetical protein